MVYMAGGAHTLLLYGKRPNIHVSAAVVPRLRLHVILWRAGKSGLPMSVFPTPKAIRAKRVLR